MFRFKNRTKKANKEIPGSPNYKEIVDFGEFIGYDVDKKGIKTATTWGKIHYSKKGAHIVPTKAR